MLTNFTYIFFEEESGQGITEYGAVLAFVGVLIAAIFTAGQGALGLAVKNAFSTTTNALSQLTTSAS